MEKILFIAFTEADGSLAKTGLEALHAATELNQTIDGAELIAGLVGENAQPAANQIANAGAKTILAVSGAPFASSRYATDAAAVEALAKQAEATLIISASTIRGQRTLPGVAQRLNGRADSHVAGVAVTDGKPTISRWYYRQRMEAKIQREQRSHWAGVWHSFVRRNDTTPWSSRMTTIANSVTKGVRSSRCRAWTLTPASSTPARSRSLCSPVYG